jgi:hypothetical protein
MNQFLVYLKGGAANPVSVSADSYQVDKDLIEPPGTVLVFRFVAAGNSFTPPPTVALFAVNEVAGIVKKS